MLTELKYMIKRKAGDLLRRFERYSEDSYIESIGQVLNSPTANSEERLDLRVRIAFMCCIHGMDQVIPEDTVGSWTFKWKRPMRFKKYPPPFLDQSYTGPGKLECDEDGNTILVLDGVYELCVSKVGRFHGEYDLAMLYRTPTTHGAPWEESLSIVKGDVSDEWLYRAFRYASGLDSEWVEPC
jgi:hypothetical protein